MGLQLDIAEGWNLVNFGRDKLSNMRSQYNFLQVLVFSVA